MFCFVLGVTSRSDLLFLRCALLSYLILNHDHSYDEIMSAAAGVPYRLPYRPYRDMETHRGTQQQQQQQQQQQSGARIDKPTDTARDAINDEADERDTTFTHIMAPLIPDTAALDPSHPTSHLPPVRLHMSSPCRTCCCLWCADMSHAYNARLITRLHARFDVDAAQHTCVMQSMHDDATTCDACVMDDAWGRRMIARWTRELYRT